MFPAVPHPVVLVTGAGAPRVGDRVARALAARGYRLVLHAQSSLPRAEETAAKLRSTGGQAIALAADLRDEQAVKTMVQAAAGHFGRIDGLVNCAAIWQRKPLEDVTADDVRRHFEVNTLGTFLCCREAGLVMTRQAEGGAIVNVGDWAIARPYRDYAAYFPSKGAIPAMTRSLAVELGTRNPRVRVNAVMPGPVLLPDSIGPEERAAIVAATLAKREGTPEHVADAVIFLLENDFVTGVCLRVDGGRSIYAGDA
jgi:pteridine reductase